MRHRTVTPSVVAFLLAFLLMAPQRASQAWPSLGATFWGYPTFEVHHRIATNALDDPDVQRWLRQRGLDAEQIAMFASREPPGFDHWSFHELADGSFIDEMEPTEIMLGKLLHCTGDSGVAVNHSPALEWYTDSDFIELHYELAGEQVVDAYTWSLPDGDLETESDRFYYAMESTTNAFKNLPESQKRYWRPETQDLTRTSLADATRWSRAVIEWYIRRVDNLETTEPMLP